MSRFRVEPKARNTLVKVSGATIAVALHLAVLGTIVYSSPSKPEMEAPEAVEIRFVEIADEVVDTAPDPDAPDEPVEADIPVPEEIPYPPPEPHFEPEPEPEPVVE